MNDPYVIRKKIESLGFTRSIGSSLYKHRRNVEYWVQVNEDESIRFESFERHAKGFNYDLSFKNINQFTRFAQELLKFVKKEVYQ
jgi:hypothetical protein